MKPKKLLEYVHSAGVNIDASPGLLRGVKILGLRSNNGNRYTSQALQTAQPLYEGIKVNVNHPPHGQEKSPRDYRDRLGKVVNVRVTETGLYGDFQYNPKHPLAEQLAWDAQHAPENVGFSHNAEGRGQKVGEEFLVEEIVSVRSVDLVADPASTRGLFEAQLPTPASETTEEERHILQEENLSLRQEIALLQEQLQELRTALEVEQAIAEAQLPAEAITELFRQTLLEARDAHTRQRLLQERKRFAGAIPLRPLSRPSEHYELPDAKTFAAKLQS